MKKESKIRNTIILIIYLLSASSLLSMSNNWKLTLINGDTISNVSLQRLDGDSLVVSDTAFTKHIWIDSIVEVRQVNKSHFRVGAGIGLLAGITIGALIGRASYHEPAPSTGDDMISFDINFGPSGAEMSTLGGGLLGGLSGFLIGGIIGGSSRKDEIINLANKNHDQKADRIKLIFLNE